MIHKKYQRLISKICIKCKKGKVHCRDFCKNCYDKWLKKNNPTYYNNQKDNTKKWIKANKEKYKKGQQNWIAKQDKDYLRDYKRMKQLEKYGLTLLEYSSLLKKQKSVCAICGRRENKKNLAVDHDHKTGRVRGLLCFRCNFGLPFFSEDYDLFLKICNYLKHKNEKRKKRNSS